MANTLILNQNQVWNGLGTLTYTVAMAGGYNVQVQTTYPAWTGEGSGAGSGHGLGAGTGGGGEGFTGGDLGTGHGGVGQGFGPTNGYQQPPADGSNQTSTSGVTSGLSILVKQNGATIYTALTPAVVQSAQQFKTSFLGAVNDVITVVFASSGTQDNTLNPPLTSNVSIGQGL